MLAITTPDWVSDPIAAGVLILFIILIFTPASPKCRRK